MIYLCMMKQLTILAIGFILSISCAPSKTVQVLETVNEQLFDDLEYNHYNSSSGDFNYAEDMKEFFDTPKLTKK